MANTNFIVQNGLTVGGQSGASITTEPTSGAMVIVPAPTATAPNPTAMVFTTNGTITAVSTTGGTYSPTAVNTAAATSATSSLSTFANLTVTGNLIVQGTATYSSTEYVGGVEVVAGNLVANSGVASTNTTTGAAVISGGVGISGALYTGSTATHAGNVNITAGGGLTTTQTTGYLFNEATTTLNIGAAATTVNLGNGSGITTILGVTSHNGNLVAASGTASTSGTTGALVVRGGAGISGDLQVGGLAVINGNLTIGGNLSVTGQSVSIGASSLSITDPVINLNTPSDLTPLTTTTTADIGIKFHYYSGSDRHGFLGRAVDTGYLEYYADGNDTANVFTGTVYGTIKSGAAIFSNSTAATNTTSGALQVTGGAGIAGALYAATSYDNGSRVVTSVTPTGGTDISIASLTSTGPTVAWTINNTSTLATVTGRGASTSTAVTFNGQVNVGASIVPTTSNTYTVGSSTSWFSGVYAQNFYGTSTTAKYADLAENYQADKTYPAGTVVMFGGGAEVTVADADTTAVAGVVSTNPAHLMNGSLQGTNVIPLALQGRVPCMVIGPVSKGDLMISAGFGYAKSATDPKVGQVIGKALQDVAFAGKAVIEVVVGRV